MNLLAALVSLTIRGHRPDQELYVLAAASLKDAFQAISRDFESVNPGVHVRLSFAGSQQLATQIKQGAPADVFASASGANLVGVPYDRKTLRTFAFNKLIVVSRTRGPSLPNLKALDSVKRLVVAAPSVPVGRYTQEMMDTAGTKYGAGWVARVRSHVVSEEQDVRSVLAKVVLGEADSGIVYVSDANSAGAKVRRTEIPAEFNPTAIYPAVVPSNSKNAALGLAFVRFLFTDSGQRELVKQGFLSPLTPDPFIVIIEKGKPRGFQPKSIPRLPQKSLRLSVHGKDFTARGALLSSILKAGKTLTVWAADGYTDSIDLRAALKAGAILSLEKDGNARLYVPGQKPSTWVQWVRRMSVD